MKIALVHDDFTQKGGAERLFAEIVSIYPEAPIYTSIANSSKVPNLIDDKRIKTSFLQKIPLAQHLYKAALPLYPLAFESFNFDEFDIVLSSTTRFAKAVITKPKTIHICYINSVPRFLYDQKTQGQYLPNLAKAILAPYFAWLKRWDKAASARVDLYVANSENVARQVKVTYGRNSAVVYPAVDTEFFNPKRHDDPKQDYYLIVSRLVKWKKIDLAIEALEKDQQLIIVGDGPDKNRLHSLAGENIVFKSDISREELLDLYQDAKALIVTQVEDFGIAIAEAQACGTPVIAYRGGGAAEIIVNEKTGLLYTRQTTESLKGAIGAHSKLKWNQSVCRENALKFTKAIFVQNFKKAIDEYVKRTHRS